MSFKQGRDIIAWPPKVFRFDATLANYSEVLSSSDFIGPLKNTFIVGIGSLLVTLVIGLPASYAFARFDFKRKEDIAFTFLSLRFAPELLVILPLFVIYSDLGLNNTHIGLILAYQLITFPLLVWMMRSFYEDVPVAIEEAVLVDGGGSFHAFRMATRLVASGLAASCVLAFIYAWNTYSLPLVLAGKDTTVVTSAILGYIKFADIEWGRMAAATVLSILPCLVIASFTLRYMIRGLTAGVVKG